MTVSVQPMCRHCGHELGRPVLDLGHQPPSNAYLTAQQLEQPETTYPLRLYVCGDCWLAQLPAHAAAHELFTADYAYFSSVSSTWVAHARRYVEGVISRIELGAKSLVVELASNDGYLLQHVRAAGIPCLGIEPTAAVAGSARQKGIETLEAFFGLELARDLRRDRGAADLIVGNNVLAHVPDVNDFVAGVSHLLAERGIATFEFPHVLQLLRENQFDTIYHEHYSYLSLGTVRRIAEQADLEVFDVEELTTHGGSLRVWLQKKDSRREPVSSNPGRVDSAEDSFGLQRRDTYEQLQVTATAAKNGLLRYLLDAKASRRKVGAYGAAAKGNTFLNYAGIRSDLLPYVADKAPSKQGRYLPGSHIPIVDPEALFADAPASLLVLPWNLITEIREELGPRLPTDVEMVTAIPAMSISTPCESS